MCEALPVPPLCVCLACNGKLRLFWKIFAPCLLVFVICYVVEDDVFRPYWFTIFSNFMFQGTYRRSLHYIAKYSDTSANE